MDQGAYKNEYSFGTYFKPFELVPGLLLQGSIDWLKEIDDYILLADFKSSKGTDYLSPHQIILYILAVEKIFKKKVKEAFYLMLRTNTRIKVNITQERKDELLQDFIEVNNKIKKNIFVPNATIKNCKGCSYRNDCSDSVAKDVTGEIEFKDL